MRDPRQNPYGYISRAATGQETFTSMFAWFPDLKSLTEYLRRIEPQIFDVGSCDPDANEDERQELDEFIEYMEPVVSAITLQGLTDELNIKYNEAAYPVSRIEWWGLSTRSATPLIRIPVPSVNRSEHVTWMMRMNRKIAPSCKSRSNRESSTHLSSTYSNTVIDMTHCMAKPAHEPL